MLPPFPVPSCLKTGLFHSFTCPLTIIFFEGGGGGVRVNRSQEEIGFTGEEGARVIKVKRRARGTMVKGLEQSYPHNTGLYLRTLVRWVLGVARPRI